MSYNISINGTGVPDDVVTSVFEEAVRALRSARLEGAQGPTGGCSNTPDLILALSAEDVDRPPDPEPAPDPTPEPDPVP